LAGSFNVGFSGPAWGLRHGVASEHPLATLAGVSVLEQGGSAVDAAVAVSLMLAVTQPHLGGVGGDFFALVKEAGGAVKFVDGGGPAPSNLERGLVGSRVPEDGPLSVTVPGMIEGLYRMWLEWGIMPWEDLVAPAIAVAERGFAVHDELKRAIRVHGERIARDPGSRALLEALSGRVARLRGLARLLRLIAGNPREFYEGDPARRIADYVASRGGALSREDLASYRASIREPVEATAWGCRLYEAPPPTQGVTGLHMIVLLEELYGERGTPEPFSRERAEMLLEAARIAYAARDALLGDPRFMHASVKEILSLREPPGPPREGGGGDTTFFTVSDGELLVAGIQSLYWHFGSGVTEPYYMVTLNNRAKDFTLEEGHPNRLGPGRRPRHTLSALIAGCGPRSLALGASGGNYRPQQHALLFTNIAAHGMSLSESINAPRLLWDPASGKVIHEGWDYPGEVLAWPNRRAGVAAGAALEDGVIGVYEDPRGVGRSLAL